MLGFFGSVLFLIGSGLGLFESFAGHKIYHCLVLLIAMPVLPVSPFSCLVIENTFVKASSSLSKPLLPLMKFIRILDAIRQSPVRIYYMHTALLRQERACEFFAKSLI